MSYSTKIALQTAALIFAALILHHWLTAGTDEILEGPLETPDRSHVGY